MVKVGKSRKLYFKAVALKASTTSKLHNFCGELTVEEKMVPKARLLATLCWSKPIALSAAAAPRARTQAVRTVPITPRVVTAPKLLKNAFFLMPNPVYISYENVRYFKDCEDFKH